MPDQVQDQLLVGLTGGVDAHVRERGGGQQPAEEVERLRPHRPRPCGRRLAVHARERVVDPRAHARQRGGVGREEGIHRALVVGAQLGVAVVAIAAARHRRVVGDVARRLLEVGGGPRPLQHLGQHVRDPLAGDVRAAELRHRVVAITDEDALVELRGALAFAAVPGAARGHGVRELVEEEAAQRARIARVAGEERALDRLGQVHQREHRPVEIREVRREPRALGGGQVVGRVAHGRRRLAPHAAGAAGGPSGAGGPVPAEPAGRSGLSRRAGGAGAQGPSPGDPAPRHVPAPRL